MATDTSQTTETRWPKTGLLPWFRGETIGQRIFKTRATDTLPQTITHDRIYILPSRRGWMFLLSLMIMLITSINYNLNLGYALCFMLTGLFTAALISTYRNLAGLEVKNIEGSETIAGTPLGFTVTLANPGKSGRWGIDIGNDEVTQRSDLATTGPLTINLPLPTSRRGIQPCGRLTISSDYPLGLWFTWSYLHVPCDGLVFPVPEVDPPPVPSSFNTLTEGQSRLTNQGDFVSIRPYQPGDSPGSIAWKTAARGLGLYTREFAAEQRNAEVTLRWDGTRGLDNSEHRISRLAAWAHLATLQEVPFSLVLPSETLAMGHGPHHGKAAQRMLALH